MEGMVFFKYFKLKLYLSMMDYTSSKKISMGKCGDTNEYHFHYIKFAIFFFTSASQFLFS